MGTLNVKARLRERDRAFYSRIIPMNNDMRPEIQELIRVAERLIGFAHREGELTDAECDAIMFYAKELEREMRPFCPNHCEIPSAR